MWLPNRTIASGWQIQSSGTGLIKYGWFEAKVMIISFYLHGLLALLIVTWYDITGLLKNLRMKDIS